ncbi:MAG: DUF3887 domain-containing protein [Cyanobacteriota bacterium]|nr:DUF3887 domain-containing protein [Cyanobacteriota bacterium]
MVLCSMRRLLLRYGVVPLALAALAIPFTQGATRAVEPTPAVRATSAAVVEQRARAAAERVLKALRDGDAQARYNQFSPDLQRMTSPYLVSMNMRRQPKIVRWEITSVIPGIDSSTVEARLQTSAGERTLLMVIDENGRLAGYHINMADLPAEKVVADFMEALIDGRFVAAASFLSPEMQEEISAAGLQRKWQVLQRRTGNVVKVRRIARSESTAEVKLLLVNTQFTRTTDNLFVILDNSNQIVGVDFPTDPPLAGPAAQP